MDDGRTFKDRLSFISALDPLLASLLLRAAQLGHDDPASAAVALRAFGETVLRKHLGFGRPAEYPGYADMLGELRRSGRAPKEIVERLDTLRHAGNHGAHPGQFAHEIGSVNNHIQTAWKVAQWLHVRAGRRPEDVPAFEPPTPADTNAIFRDAVLGGSHGMGDPVAKFHVARAILAHQAQRYRELKERKNPFEFMSVRTEEIRVLLGAASHEVPAARTEMAAHVAHRDHRNRRIMIA